MSEPAPDAYRQLGKFIVSFQHAEDAINEILVLLSKADDDEAVRILMNELGYSQRLKTVDALFTRFVDLRQDSDKSETVEFHKLIGDLGNLGTRRNEFVHSKYVPWRNVEGAWGLIRKNSRFHQRIREEREEELLPGAFDADLERVQLALRRLEEFRLRILDWLYPDVST